MFFLSIPVFGEGGDVLLIIKAFFDNHIHDAVQHGHVSTRLELQHVGCEPFQTLVARIHHDQLAAALGELLEIGRRDRMIFERVGPDHNRHIRILNLIEGGCHSTGSNVFDQRGNGRRVAQTRAVVDVVVTKALANELLEKVGFFVRTFGRSKAGHFSTAPFQATGRKVQGLIPRCLAKELLPIVRVHVKALGRGIFATDQRLCQAMLMVDIIIAKAPFDAQTPLIRGAIDAFDILDFVVFDFDGDLAANAAKGADAFHFTVVVAPVANLFAVHQARRHQSAGWAGLNAFAAGHASRFPHRIIKVECWIGIVPPTRHPDHVVDLNFAARTHTKTALDASIQIDAHRNMAVIQKRDVVLFHRGKAAVRHLLLVGHVPQMR